MNLSVGVIVDKFMEMKPTNNNAKLTEPQKNWINCITSLYARWELFTEKER